MAKTSFHGSAQLRAWSGSIFTWLVLLGVAVGAWMDQQAPAETSATQLSEKALPGTAELEKEGDLASEMVDAIDKFLDHELDRAAQRRQKLWEGQLSRGWPEVWLNERRQRLAKILGVVDERVRPVRLTALNPPGSAPPVAQSPCFDVVPVRWDVFSDVTGEGLLLVPRGTKVNAIVIAVPDADITPEALAGIEPGIPPESQYARRIAEGGCSVLIPALISRQIVKRGNVSLTHREYIYRPAYELGRHIIGFEIQKILAAVDWFSSQGDPATSPPIGVIGWGEGGLLGFYSAALDPRIRAVGVSGYFGPRENTWRHPVDRNVFSLVREFGDAEITLLIHPRPIVIEAARAPEVVIPKGLGGAPGQLETLPVARVQEEVNRARELLKLAGRPSHVTLITSGDGTGLYGTEAFLKEFLKSLTGEPRLAPLGEPPTAARPDPWRTDRLERQIDELDRHIQKFLTETPEVRRRFWSKLDTSSLEKFSQSVEWYRTYFYEEVIGRFDLPLENPNPRTRLVYDREKWLGYDVVLDVFDGVFAYGILLVPKNLAPGERRPVVVCQHGLEGRPQETIEGDHRAYHDFAARLADLGFVVFAPQNPYIFGDRFRTLQRKANPLGKTLFSVIVPQHQQIVNWLASLEFVDPNRIAFYGLSYGGKTAMRVPPLVPQYCAVICSADFNDWVWKNVSTKSRYSYVFTGEYEIFEFDLGQTFNYAEMATLIAPRPFMVERGHFDGVAPDETVAYEFAKVRFLYQALLRLKNRTQIEWFVGPHTIHGVGTFEFLRRHLQF